MKKLLIIVLLICSIQFWGFVLIPQSIYNLSNALSLLLMGYYFYNVLLNKGMLFRNAIIIFLIGIVINIISAFINQGQGPLDTFIAFSSFYFILFYFSLHEAKIDREFLEKVIIVFAIIYSVFYVIQVVAYPNVIFVSNMYADRGTIRIRLAGNGFLVLAYFIFLNRFLITLKFKNVPFFLIFFVILLMAGFRTLTLTALLLSFLMYIKLFRFSFIDGLLLSLMVLVFVGLFQFEGTSKILDGMLTTSKNEMQEGRDNIRLTSLKYFFNDYPKNSSYFITGGGLPASESRYAYYIRYLQKYYFVYWVDLGILGLYIIVGLVACIGLLWYSIKAVFLKLPRDMIYLNFYFAYLLIVSFTTMEIYRGGIFAVEALVLYLIDLAMINNNRELDSKST